MRLYGFGSVLESTHVGYAELVNLFPDFRGKRAIIKLTINRIADSCGFGVPRYKFIQERDTYLKIAEKLSDEELRQEQLADAKSLDGLVSLEVTSY